MTLDIRVAASADEARAALADGYEPVECSFGGESVVGPLGLDHHGRLAERQPVCIQVLQREELDEDYRADRMVVTGVPDADATIAVSLLLGIRGGVPTPRDLLDMAESAEGGYTYGDSDPDEAAAEETKRNALAWHRVIELVALADLGHWHDLSAEGHAGAIVLAWHARQRARGAFPALRADQCARWGVAVEDWAALLALPEDAPELLAARIDEMARRA